MSDFDFDVNFQNVFLSECFPQVFASSIVGAHSDAVDNDSQASYQTEGGKKENYYKVVGTMFDPEKNEKPAWVKDGYKVILIIYVITFELVVTFKNQS